MPELRQAPAANSGKTTGQASFPSATLAIYLPGSGEIVLDVLPKYRSSTITGFGKVLQER